MREVFAATALSIALMGCARPQQTEPRFADLLQRTTDPIDVRKKMTYPSGECLNRALEYVGNGSRIMQEPLPSSLRQGLEEVLDTLHPSAKQVLRRTSGIWFAQDISNAAAVFLPCELDADRHTGGFVLIDVNQFPLDQPLTDVEVPTLYWRALTSSTMGAVQIPDTDPPRRPLQVAMHDHALRYLVLHELGHAFSLLSGEFGLDREQRMQVRDTHGFVGFSWRMMTTDRKYLPLAGRGPIIQAVVPKSELDPFAWGSILEALDADADLLAPGYALAQPRSAASRARDICLAVERLPRAGFVTPTAARYPTEDFAEMFAHAILADEGKLRPDIAVPIDLPGCPIHELQSPYFSAWTARKRAYIEQALHAGPLQARAEAPAHE